MDEFDELWDEVKATKRTITFIETLLEDLEAPEVEIQIQIQAHDRQTYTLNDNFLLDLPDDFLTYLTHQLIKHKHNLQTNVLPHMYEDAGNMLREYIRSKKRDNNEAHTV